MCHGSVKTEGGGVEGDTRPFHGLPVAACVKDFVFEALSLDPKQAKAIQRLRSHQVRHTTVLWGRAEEERKEKQRKSN